MREKYDYSPEGLDAEAEFILDLVSRFAPGTIFAHRQYRNQRTGEIRWLKDGDTIVSGWVSTGNSMANGYTLKIEPVIGETGTVWRYYHDDNGTEGGFDVPASKVKGPKL